MKNYRIEAAILAIGLALAGLFVYCGFKAFSQRDRVVSVRGLSEREVNADHVIWPITYKMTGNDLQSLYAQINQANVCLLYTSRFWPRAHGSRIENESRRRICQPRV